MTEESTTPDLVEMTRFIWGAVNRQDWQAALGFYTLGMRGRVAGGTSSVEARSTWPYEWLNGKIARVAIYVLDQCRATAERLAHERG